MKDIIHKVKDFKIVPDKFRSSTTFKVLKEEEEYFEAELRGLSDEFLNDYAEGGSVEIFGSGQEGLVYFVTSIKERQGNILKIYYPEEHKDIQRREYSRVRFNGKIDFLEFDNLKTKSVDISGGGLKFLVNKQLEQGETYNISLELENNLKIKCLIEVVKTMPDYQEKDMFVVSGKFMNMESVDRIALIQYTFKVLLESENKK